ncbi:MAG TPA: NAD-dependent epimerase/dehydratase family protein [Patescibacteria group bacterium]|nr:NAD-dependent epimerase/dehydratase family protein [Patescibacteria group bacterium]
MEKILITGISGEVGFGLVKKLFKLKKYKLVALDIKKPEKEIASMLHKFYLCNISDKIKLNSIFKKEKYFDEIFHLASILSTGGEKNPELATDVNVKGTLNLLEISTLASIKNKKSTKFIFPSSIASHGNPITIYGIAKLACENFGIYYSKYYKLLDTNLDRKHLIDFRCIRFPGLLSPDTLPSGGTSDYGPEMLHSAAQGKEYDCFVRPDSKIPFMAMSDAVEILFKLAQAKKNKLTKNVYEVSGFSVTAKEIEKEVKKNFPKAILHYKINKERQKIVDSWPKKVGSDDAIHDWGYKIKYNFKSTFSNYLIPKIKERYSNS